MIKKIFRRRQLAFEPVDPLGGGLREMIERERRESEAIKFKDDVSDIHQFWSSVDFDSDF